MNLTIKEISERFPQYFAKGEIKYWGSKFETEPNKHNIFIESVDNFDKTMRIYKLGYYCEHTNKIYSLSELNSLFSTLDKAKTYLARLVEQLDTKTQKIRCLSLMDSNDTRTRIFIEYEGSGNETIEVSLLDL